MLCVQEARQILNVSKETPLEEINKVRHYISTCHCCHHGVQTYERLFQLTDKKSGGSFYLQSKACDTCPYVLSHAHVVQVYRAKERIDVDLGQTTKPPPPPVQDKGPAVD